MGNNRDIAQAWRYHNATKHSFASVRDNPHTLDWANMPLLFKIYPTLEVTRLPRETRPTAVPALEAISAVPPFNKPPAALNLETLAHLLFLSAGITKSKKYPGGETFFRAAACTGALYEIELYLVTGELPDLPAGVYHFGVAEFGLRQLRAGDYRRVLIEATANEASANVAPVLIVCTGTYWRNAWKYQARTYRHFGWDNGTILANLLACTSALRLPARVLAGFLDEKVNRLLDLDTQREVAFSIVSVGSGDSGAPKSPEVKPLGLPLIPLSKTETDYPLMREMHAASSLDSSDDLKRWKRPSKKARAKLQKRDGSSAGNRSGEKPGTIPLQPLDTAHLPSDPIEQVIVRRGSSRRFVHAPISFAQLSTILERSARGIPADFLMPFGAQLNDLYLIVNDVDGLAPGSYVYRRDNNSLELLRRGNFRKLAGYLGLEQSLPADASVAVFFLANLNTTLERLGNRGYRAVQLEAGILGGKLYLAAYSQGVGATGLTFYDDDVVRFFSPHAEGKSAIFLVALGKSH